LLTHVSSFPTSTCFCLALLLLQHRDWIQDEDFPRSLGNDRTVWATEVSKQLPFLSLCFLPGCRICWSRCLGSNSGQTHAAATGRHVNSAVPDGGVVPIANAHDEPGDYMTCVFLGGGGGASSGCMAAASQLWPCSFDKHPETDLPPAAPTCLLLWSCNLFVRCVCEHSSPT
jgi:hypothetical protein